VTFAPEALKKSAAASAADAEIKEDKKDKSPYRGETSDREPSVIVSRARRFLSWVRTQAGRSPRFERVLLGIVSCSSMIPGEQT
jgi:hypothetical protein